MHDAQSRVASTSKPIAAPAQGPFFRFLRRLESGLLEFSVAEAEHDFGATWTGLQTCGFVRAAPPGTSARCPDCDGDACRLSRMRDRGGHAVLYVHCPECGPVAVPPAALQRSRIDVPAFVSAVGRAVGPCSQPIEQIPDALWRLGPIGSALRSKEAYLALGAFRAQRAAIVSFLARRRKAVLFIPTSVGAGDWEATVPEVTLSLSDFLSLDTDSLMFDHARLAAVCRDSVSESGRSPKPRSKRADRAAKIEKLIVAMKEHLMDARDRARDTKVREGVAYLLPRPRQWELAQGTGMTDSDVSRCLRDPSEPAILLRLLWRTATDLDSVMTWRPPRNG